MHTSSPYQSNQQQLFMMAAAIFVSVTAAVIVSTVIIMSLMRGEIAGALSAHTQPVVPATTQMASSCAATPADMGGMGAASSDEGAPVTMQLASVVVPHHMKAPWMGSSSVSHSFNSTNTSSTTTTNSTTNVHSNTLINDSYNDNSKFSHNSMSNSHNPVIVKDNTVTVDSNNGNALNSNNSATTNTAVTTTTNSNNTTNLASNNTTTVASNNTVENHLLSDNTTVIVPALP